MKWDWKVVAKGFAMGMADLVPGVSGGTVAFISGIYTPLLQSLSALSGEGRKALQKGEFREAWTAIQGPFLLSLGLGIFTAILALATPLHWLLEHHPVELRAFFTGLVLTSVPLVGRHLDRWGLDTVVWAAAGCAVAGFITSLPPMVQSEHPVFLLLSGMLAICAMLLPGISGSFLLLILGAYAPVLFAVKTLDFPKIAAFGTGAVMGLLLFSRALKWLLSERRRPTLAVLTGFLVGSVQALWPWKRAVQPLYTHSDGRVEWLLENTAPPAWDGTLLAAMGLAILGGLVVWGLQQWGRTQGQHEVR